MVTMSMSNNKIASLGLLLIILIFILMAYTFHLSIVSTETPQSNSSGQQAKKKLHIQDSRQVVSFVKWTNYFSYVPNGITSCTELFSDNKELEPEFKKKYDQYINETKKYKISEGFSATYREEFLAYIKSVQAPFVRTVCETGFNGGHSTFTWLEANPHTHVYSFDIGVHEYSKPLANHLQKLYPGRLNNTWGDSVITLPQFHKNHPDIKCDLIIIDGGHNNKVCKSDFDTFKQMANYENILILDNYPDDRSNWMKQLGDVWEHGKQEGDISEIFHCHYPGKSPQGFSVGRFIVQ